MRQTIFIFCFFALIQSIFAEKKDWLIDGSSYKAEVKLSPDKKCIELTNG